MRPAANQRVCLAFMHKPGRERQNDLEISPVLKPVLEVKTFQKNFLQPIEKTGADTRD
jgi:hypothetical protein